MFILNLFVGVVIDKFNRMRDHLSGFNLMTESQRIWVEMQRFMIKQTLFPKKDRKTSIIRKKLLILTESKHFDYFITFCICANTIIMAMRYYNMPLTYAKVLEDINFGFSIIFNIEFLLKFLALCR